MDKLKGWKTRIFNMLMALLEVFNLMLEALPALELGDGAHVMATRFLVVATIVGNAVLREITTGPAGGGGQ